MDASRDLGGYADVDRAADPATLRDYLDEVRAHGAVAAWKERTFAALRPRPGDNLLDVGCGTGDDALALSALVAPGGRVTGIDRSATMIAEARRRAGDRPGVAFAVGDVLALDLPDGAVDGARAERVMLHLDEPGRAIAEMARVVRPGGWIVVAEPDWATFVIDAPDPDAGRLVADASARRFRSPSAGQALRRLVRAAGTDEVEVAARTLVVTEPDEAARIFRLDEAARRAAADGMLSADRAAAWLDGVARAGAAGDLLVAMTAFMAAGRRA